MERTYLVRMNGGPFEGCEYDSSRPTQTKADRAASYAVAIHRRRSGNETHGIRFYSEPRRDDGTVVSNDGHFYRVTALIERADLVVMNCAAEEKPSETADFQHNL